MSHVGSGGPIHQSNFFLGAGDGGEDGAVVAAGRADLFRDPALVLLSAFKIHQSSGMDDAGNQNPARDFEIAEGDGGGNRYFFSNL